MKLKKILNGVDCKLNRIPDIDVKHISYDSRNVTNGSLFIAIDQSRRSDFDSTGLVTIIIIFTIIILETRNIQS